MYNRYIPQSDGSYHCSRVPDPASCRQPSHSDPHSCNRPSCQNFSQPGDFLRQLLPQGFDTGDLLVVLLLLLMAGDSEKGRHNALLTLAFYFIL